MRPWLIYTLIRLAMFIGALTVMLLLGIGWVIGAVLATLASLALSIIFLGELRGQVAAALRERVEKPKLDADSEIEDEQIKTKKG